MDKLTKRQEEVLLNIHLKDQSHDGARINDAFPSYDKRHGQPIPAWGRPDPYGRGRSMGGATRRMVERLADEGFIPFTETPRGHRYPRTGTLTSKALRYLKERHPDLPGIVEALRAAVEREMEEERQAKEASEAADKARQERVLKRSFERRNRMAAILQDFQVRHDLTGDQLEAMWLRIVDEEHKL